MVWKGEVKILKEVLWIKEDLEVVVKEEEEVVVKVVKLGKNICWWWIKMIKELVSFEKNEKSFK